SLPVFTVAIETFWRVVFPNFCTDYIPGHRPADFPGAISAPHLAQISSLARPDPSKTHCNAVNPATAILFRQFSGINTKQNRAKARQLLSAFITTAPSPIQRTVP